MPVKSLRVDGFGCPHGTYIPSKRASVMRQHARVKQEKTHQDPCSPTLNGVSDHLVWVKNTDDDSTYEIPISNQTHLILFTALAVSVFPARALGGEASPTHSKPNCFKIYLDDVWNRNGWVGNRKTERVMVRAFTWRTYIVKRKFESLLRKGRRNQISYIVEVSTDKTFRLELTKFLCKHAVKHMKGVLSFEYVVCRSLTLWPWSIINRHLAFFEWLGKTGRINKSNNCEWDTAFAPGFEDFALVRRSEKSIFSWKERVFAFSLGK